MAVLRPLAAVAAVALVQTVGAWHFELPPCLAPFRPFVYTGCFEDNHNPQALTYRSSMSSQNMTVEKCVAECKGNGYRYAGLEYYGECYCGATVNGKQAVDPTKCSTKCTGNSSQTCGGNDHLSIYQDPSFPVSDDVTINNYVPLGCYTDESTLGKTLSWPMDKVINQNDMTPTKCLTACKGQGFPFAGLEFGQECYCGVVLANDTRKADPKDCKMPCKGDTSKTCGGSSRLDVYIAKELESLEPCNYQPPSGSSSSSSTTSSTSTSSAAPTYPPTTTTSSAAPTSPTTYPPTTTPPTTTTRPTTSPTSSLCLATVTVPSKCEYGCGKWCSDDLPDWNDKPTCDDGHSRCKLQVADCFSNAGWPSAMDCFGYASWCSDIKSYCGNVPKGGKYSKKECFGKKPPKGGKPPTTTTTWVPCKATSTSSTLPSSASTQCPIPTATNICVQPSSNKYGYGPGNPVGGIEIPVVTCNDLKSEYQAGNVFKLYTDKDTRKCGSYTRPKCSNACADACKKQYDQCSATYVQGCKDNDDDRRKGGNKFSFWRRDALLRRSTPDYFEYAGEASIEKRTLWGLFGKGWTDDWSMASNKCKAQYDDCLQANKGVNPRDKCTKYATGPW